MKSLRTAILLALPAIVSACAAPTLQSPTTDPAAVAREAAMQRKFVIERIKAQQERVSRVMFRINVGAADLCKDHVTGTFGLAGMTASQFPGAYENIARQEFGFDDGLTVTAVFPESPAEKAGLAPGDRIVSFGNNGASTSSQAMQTYLKTSATNGQAVSIQYRRHEETKTASAIPALACNFPASIKEDTEINAYADGQQIVFNTGLLNFAASEEELAVIASHELSHNVLDHTGKKKENVLVGGALGLAADLLVIATTGVNPGLYRTGAQLGAQAYSVEFEKEADYEGLYLMRRAGYSVKDAGNVWRRLAAENPSSITIGRTHPTTPERFIAMNTTISEIQSKEAQRLALVPNLKAGSGGQITTIALATGSGPQTAFLPPTPGRGVTNNANMPLTGSDQPTAFSAVSIANSPHPLGIKASGDVTSSSITAVYMGKDPHGVAIGSLEPDGTAAKAGVREGDVITRFNGHRVETFADLKSLISSAASPDAKVELNRSGKVVSVQVHL